MENSIVKFLENEFHKPIRLFGPNEDYLLNSNTGVVSSQLEYKYLFTHLGEFGDIRPKRIGVLFSGGPAPGGHDVLNGILSYLREDDTIIGFRHGFSGLLSGDAKELNISMLGELDGVGGFDFLGTDRTKIKTDEQFEQVKQVITKLALNVLIVIGGDDSNTNALYLADYLFDVCQVIGVPKTIDGDLIYDPYLSVPFGFHTATQHYSNLVKNLLIDTVATRKYWHVIRLMGRAASHVVLDVALQTCPHACVLSEEIVHNKWTTMDLVRYFSDVIQNRYSKGCPYGVLLFPEGLIQTIPEFKAFLDGDYEPINNLYETLGIYNNLVSNVDEDSYGNKNLSLIPTEDLFIQLIQGYLDSQNLEAKEIKMVPHFFGYTGRSEDPTTFDSIYAKLLGKSAYEVALSNVTGVVVGCQFNSNDVMPLGIPLNSMVGYDSTRNQFVVNKALVSTESFLYKTYKEQKKGWELSNIGFPRNQKSNTPFVLSIKEDIV